jgi:hypothetical protein
MKELLIAALIGITAATGILLYNYSAMWYFTPKYAEIRNQTFKNTQAYNDGMVNDLADLRLQYLAANNKEQKDAIRSTVLQRFGSYPKDRLPAELRDFYFSL